MGIGFFERTPDMVFALERRQIGKRSNSVLLSERAETETQQKKKGEPSQRTARLSALFKLQRTQLLKHSPNT